MDWGTFLILGGLAFFAAIGAFAFGDEGKTSDGVWAAVVFVFFLGGLAIGVGALSDPTENIAVFSEFKWRAIDACVASGGTPTTKEFSVPGGEGAWVYALDECVGGAK